MNRMKAVREIVDGYIEKSGDPRKYYTHSYGVAAFAAMLAENGGLDKELAAVMGLLHDIYAVKAGTYENHDVEGAKIAEEIMGETGLFSVQETAVVSTAIKRHDLRGEHHEPYDEILKNADVMWPYFCDGRGELRKN